MGYGTDIQAKLGVDTSSVGTDLAGAKNQFNKWGQDVANTGATHGANFGDKLVGGLEHKVLGARHLSGALAVALGLNIEKIADHIAAAIVDGSKEGWEEALKLADSNAKLIQEKITDSLTPKKLGEELEKELQRAVDKLNSIKGSKVYGGEDSQGAAIYKDAALNAEQLKQQQEAQHEILEIEKKIRDLKKDSAKEVKEYENERKKAATEDLSDGHKIEELNKQIAGTILEMTKGTLTEGELAKKKIALLNMEHEIKLATKRITEEDTKLAKKDADDKEKAQKDEMAREEKLFSLRKSRFTETKKLTEDQNKLTDRSKLTVGELAGLTAKKDFSLGKSGLDLSFGSNEGLTDAQVEAKKKAQEVQRLEQEAEQKRLSGDVAGSEEAFGKVGKLRDELTSSGATKSTEGDKFGELRKQIAEDNIELQKTLKDLITVEKGKFVSQ